MLNNWFLLKKVCSDLLSHCGDDGESFLPRIISGNDKQIHCFGLQTKRQSMERHYPTSAPKKEFRATPSAEVMTTFLVVIMRDQTIKLRSVGSNP
jgi:hypothetical protein